MKTVILILAVILLPNFIANCQNYRNSVVTVTTTTTINGVKTTQTRTYTTGSNNSFNVSNSNPSSLNTVTKSINANSGIINERAENGDMKNYDNDGDGRTESVYVKGYYRKDGTYVRSHYRAKRK